MELFILFLIFIIILNVLVIGAIIAKYFDYEKLNVTCLILSLIWIGIFIIKMILLIIRR